ncbi:hypothetical protein J2S19_003492 [Metabacillus malikii]|uniref:Uncharacterized protein n=1 Tax=Metabacillus malikii TaxID=1504265 RepID=A0ABT9ZLY5_9BACI|nr:hypothetical protein [Metabacillus malikii]
MLKVINESFIFTLEHILPLFYTYCKLSKQWAILPFVVDSEAKRFLHSLKKSTILVT